MATIDELKQRALTVLNETGSGANTANRIGSLFFDIIDRLNADNSSSTHVWSVHGSLSTGKISSAALRNIFQSPETFTTQLAKSPFIYFTNDIDQVNYLFFAVNHDGCYDLITLIHGDSGVNCLYLPVVISDTSFADTEFYSFSMLLEAKSDGKIYGRKDGKWIALSGLSNVFYIDCYMNQALVTKTIQLDLPELSKNVRLLVKMANTNTADSVMLAIYSPISGETYTKPLYLNGKQVSASNTWQSGDVLDIYYDGSVFQATSFFSTTSTSQPSSGISDAPADSKTYGRKDGKWIALSGLSNVFYIDCYMNQALVTKTIQLDLPELSKNVRLLVKMANTNTADSVMLAIYSPISGETYTKPLYLNGKQVSASNTWQSGDVLDIYYDGSVFQATPFFSSTSTSQTSSGISDAPADSKTYGRNNNRWVTVGSNIALYAECSASADISDKGAPLSNFELIKGMRVIVKMQNENTADTVSFFFYDNEGGASKPLYYNGKRASSTNTWRAGAILDIFYDGSAFQAADFDSSALVFDLGELNFCLDCSRTDELDEIKTPGLYKFIAPFYYGSGLLQVDIVDSNRTEGNTKVNVYRQTLRTTGSLRLRTDIDYYTDDKLIYATRVTTLDGSTWKPWMKSELTLTQVE